MVKKYEKSENNCAFRSVKCCGCRLGRLSAEALYPDTVARFMSGYKNVLINYFSHDKKSDGFVPVSVGCTEVSKNTIGPEVDIAHYDSDCTVKLGNLFAERI